jgi:hypothetical protein
MNCVNPNSPEFKNILKTEPNFLLAEIMYDRAVKAIDDMALSDSQESFATELQAKEKLNLFDSTEDWDFKKPDAKKTIDNDLLNALIADKALSTITDPIQAERFEQLLQLIGKKETYRAYFENNKQVPPSSYFYEQQEQDLKESPEFVKTYDRDVESFNKPMPSIDDYINSLDDLIAEENNSTALAAAEKYASQLNIPYEIITRAEFDERFPNKANSKHFYYAGKVYLVAGTITPGDVFHEFSHPIIKAIALQNPELFNKLFNTLSNTELGADIIKTLSGDPEIEFGSQAFMEEAMVMALERINEDESVAPKSFISELFFQIKQFLRKVFGKKIDVSKLNSKTTLADLVKMINSGEEFILNKDFLEADLMVLFKKDYTAIIDRLQNTAENKTQKLFNNAYALVEEQLEQFKATEDIYSSIQENLYNEDQTGIYNKMVLGLRELATNSKGRRLVEPLDRNDVENFALKIQNFAKIIGEAESLFEEFDKKLDELKRINSLTDDHFNQLLAIANYTERWQASLTEWAKDQKLQTVSSIGTTDPLLQMFSEFDEMLTKIKNKYVEIMTDSTIDILYEHLNKTMAPQRKDLEDRMNNAKANNVQNSYEKLHLQYYGLTVQERADLNRLKNKADKTVEEIEELQTLTYRSYDSYVLTKDALKARMSNKLTDSGLMNGLMESHNLNQDVVVSGFFNYLERTFNEVNANANSMRAELLNGLYPLLKAAGYDNYYFGEGGMGKDLAQENISYRYNSQNQLEAFSEYRFKNNFINYEYKIEQLRDVAKKAKKNFNLNPTAPNKEAYEKAVEALDDFEYNYMNQDYVKEYYEIKRRYFNTPLGKKAIEAQEKIFKKINLAKETLELNPTEPNYLIELNNLQLELKQLYNKYDFATGKKKPDGSEELAIAELFGEYNKEIEPFHEFTEKPTAFEVAYNVFVEKMIEQGIPKGSDEYVVAEKQWLERNTTISVTDAYYEKRTELLERKKELLANLKLINNSIFDEAAAQEQIYGILKMAIDPYNQYDGTGLTPEAQQKITDIHKEIELAKDLFITLGGYTQQESDRYKELSYEDPNDMSDEDYVFFMDFWYNTEANLLALGIDKNVLDELKNINETLQSMSSSGITNYYVDMFEDFRKQSPEFDEEFISIMDEMYGIDLTKGDVVTPEILYNLITLNNSHLDKLKALHSPFQQWFDRNHYKKEYKEFDENGKYLGTYTGYANSAAWQYSMPNDQSYYNTRSVIGMGISNQNSAKGFISLKGIPRIPSRQYQDKKVKDEYNTVEIHKQKLIANGIPSSEIDRYHVDRNGNLIVPIVSNKGENDYLPLDLEMDPINPSIRNEYIDASYKQMFYGERDKWNLLNYLSNVHLNNQKGLDKYQKLYLSYPRERKGSVEQYDRQYFKRKWNRVLDIVWRDAADDYEFGLNAPGANSFSYKTMRKPINGSYQLDMLDVSTNIVNSMENYAYSVAQFKTLRDKNSFANVFEKVLVNLNQHPAKDAFDEALDNGKLLSPLNSKTSIRITQIKGIIDKNFRGEQIAGLFPVQKEFSNPGAITRRVAKIINVLSRSMAFKTFVLDPIKSIRNYWGGKSMIIKKATEGKSYGFADLIATRLKSGNAVAEIIKTLYAKEQVSANLQLLDLMDAVPNNLKKEIGARGSRTAVQSVAEGKIFTSERRFFSDSVPIHQLYAILNKNSFILNGVKTSLDEAVELNSDGKIETVAGVPKEFSIKYDSNGKVILGEKIKDIMSEHQAILQKSLGITNEYNEPEMYRSLLGKAVFFLMKFLPGMSSDRYQFRTKRGKFGQTRMNLATKRNELGTMVSIIQLISEAIDNKGQFWKYNNYSWQAKKGVLQILLAFAFTKIISLLTSMIGFDTDDDGIIDYWYNPTDENLISNLKSTTSIPDLPLTSYRRTIEGTNSQFKAGNYAKLHLLRLLLEVQAEEDTFFPVNFIRTAQGVVTLKAPLLDGALLRLADQMLVQGITVMAGESNEYDQAAGPLTIHDASSNKYVAAVAGSFGITGTFIDPVWAIQQRQRFITPELPWFTYYKEN